MFFFFFFFFVCVFFFTLFIGSSLSFMSSVLLHSYAIISGPNLFKRVKFAIVS